LKKLAFTIQPQHQSEWCWAAVAASIANFYEGNNKLKQCDIVNKMLILDTCCDDGSSDSCNQQFHLEPTLQRIRHLQRSQPGQPDFAAVVAEMTAGRPLAVRILWSEGGGHVVVVYGVTDDRKVHIADPATPHDEILVPFDGFVYKDIGTWDGSLFTRS
jgi:ABC-type bacteriocin/lantibiotic exporter with double-glycine peptidase domain